jgi:hypothetical protein
MENRQDHAHGNHGLELFPFLIPTSGNYGAMTFVIIAFSSSLENRPMRCTTRSVIRSSRRRVSFSFF